MSLAAGACQGKGQVNPLLGGPHVQKGKLWVIDELDGFLQVMLWSPAATIASAFINGLLNVVGG